MFTQLKTSKDAFTVLLDWFRWLRARRLWNLRTELDKRNIAQYDVYINQTWINSLSRDGFNVLQLYTISCRRVPPLTSTYIERCVAITIGLDSAESHWTVSILPNGRTSILSSPSMWPTPPLIRCSRNRTLEEPVFLGVYVCVCLCLYTKHSALPCTQRAGFKFWFSILRYGWFIPLSDDLTVTGTAGRRLVSSIITDNIGRDES